MKQIFICGLTLMAALRSVAADAVMKETALTATNTVSLDALVAQAVRENPELQFYQAELMAAKAGRKAAGLMPNPERSCRNLLRFAMNCPDLIRLDAVAGFGNP